MSSRAAIGKHAGKFAARMAWKHGRKIVSARRNAAGGGGVTYHDFYRTGEQDCGNAIDFTEFDLQSSGRTPHQIVADTFARWEEDGDLEQFWIDDNADAIENLDPRKAYAHWRRGWTACAERAIARKLEDEEVYGPMPNPNHRRHNPRSQDFLVLRINRDRSDTYAVEYDGNVTESIEDALDLAQPDPNDTVEYGFVRARDAGAARLMTPAGDNMGKTWSTAASYVKTWRAQQDSSPDIFDDGIRAGMATAIWVTSYARWAEELPPKQRKEIVGSMQGVDWSDVAPEPPSSADAAGGALYDAFEMQNDVTMSELFERAMIADKIDEADDELANSFGHYLAMSALGEGVSWFDDHAKFEIKFPDFEAWSDDGEELDWSPRRNPRRRK